MTFRHRSSAPSQAEWSSLPAAAAMDRRSSPSPASVMPETALTKTRSGGAADSGVLAAVLDELVDQQRILSEMQVHVAGEQVGRHEPFVADHVALGVLHLVGGLQVAVVAGDAAPMELGPAVELPPG